MGEVVKAYLPLASRQKIYIILVFVSLFLLFYSVWQAYPINVEEEGLLGLASYLPPLYWIGLAVLVLTSIFAFIDGELKKDAIFILLLLALGLFLFGVKVFFEVNPGNPTVFFPFAAVKDLLVSGYIDIPRPPGGFLNSYYSWPASHFINASLLESSGIGSNGITSSSVLTFIKFMPLYFMLCFVLITYGIGKRLDLPPNRCFLLSFLALSSWLLDFAGTYYPRAYALILFLTLFMLLLAPRRTTAETVAVILLFSTAVLMHGLIGLALIPAIALLEAYRRDFRFALLFFAILAAWYMFLTPLTFASGARTLRVPFENLMGLANIEHFSQPVTNSSLVSRYTLMSYGISYIALMTGCAILLLRRRITGERRKQVISTYILMIGIASVLAFGVGETVLRGYVYNIVPALSVVALSLPRRKIITALAIALMVLFTALHLPANYAGESQWGQVHTYQLKGAEFVGTKMNLRRGQFLYQAYGAQIYIFYTYDSDNYNSGSVAPGSYNDVADLMDTFINQRKERPHLVQSINTLDDLDYVVISHHGSYPPVLDARTWPPTEAGRKANLIYNSGHLQLYDNYRRH